MHIDQPPSHPHFPLPTPRCPAPVSYRRADDGPRGTSPGDERVHRNCPFSIERAWCTLLNSLVSAPVAPPTVGLPCDRRAPCSHCAVLHLGRLAERRPRRIINQRQPVEGNRYRGLGHEGHPPPLTGRTPPPRPLVRLGVVSSGLPGRAVNADWPIAAHLAGARGTAAGVRGGSHGDTDDHPDSLLPSRSPICKRAPTPQVDGQRPREGPTRRPRHSSAGRDNHIGVVRPVDLPPVLPGPGPHGLKRATDYSCPGATTGPPRWIAPIVRAPPRSVAKTVRRRPRPARAARGRSARRSSGLRRLAGARPTGAE